MGKFIKDWGMSLILVPPIFLVVVGGHVTLFATNPLSSSLAVTGLCLPFSILAVLLMLKIIFHEADCNIEFRETERLKERLVMEYGKDPKDLDGRSLKVLRSVHEAQKKIKSASRSR